MQREKHALFILRVGLGLFLLLWGIDKLLAPEATIKIFEVFYFLPITAQIAMGLGIAQILLSIAIIIGLWKKWTYTLGLLVHLVGTASTWKQLMNPFGPNHLFIAALPVLAGFIALAMSHQYDTYLAVTQED